MNKQFFENILSHSLLFGRFEMLRPLSAEEFGGVYLCIDKGDSDQLVALKVLWKGALKDTNSKDTEMAERFEREAKMALSIQHPNVVSARDFFNDDEFLAFSMEYTEGGTLGDFIHSNPNPSVSEILNILSQLSAGLKAIHAVGIVHRDLKPDNILLNSAGVLKIADFGIAVNGAEVGENTDEHIVGTINYLSPEYIEKGEFDQRSDIYAFGVIAYELMTGQLPFFGDSLLDTLTRRVRFDPVTPRELRGDLPRALSDLALKAMKRRPANRFKAMDEVVYHLELVEQMQRVEIRHSIVPDSQPEVGSLAKLMAVAFSSS